ncbi:unnamed protein product [Allacma fusca]|uniref:Uncharacterized protein n=1 Tax=Allacma fusca TaxID=39272 RepID=A0A8J2MFP7_9HEXA|nr:unnamed protein product [Allacma fusca]
MVYTLDGIGVGGPKPILKFLTEVWCLRETFYFSGACWLIGGFRKSGRYFFTSIEGLSTMTKGIYFCPCIIISGENTLKRGLL